MAAVLALGLVAAACGGDDAGVNVTDGWARTSAGMQNAGAAYMQIEGGDTADRLVAASVPSDVAGMAQIHESSMNDEGVMSMSEVEGGVEIPAGATVAFEPGGFHVMMMNLAAPLEAGQEFTVTLTFENAGEVEVPVEVREG
ncbi:MAG: copper chaperone PCu(A)C [Acidimicrobiia bacterium]|nr:copper chaperone PCu(A)C [Acidimicrobiia bacterium]